MQIHEKKFGDIKGLVVKPEASKNGVLVLLHGVGSNERNLLDFGPLLASEKTIISLRSPIELASHAYAWFQVQFTATGPVHNWAQAEQGLKLLEAAVQDISIQYSVPLNEIIIFGFSQGAIMAIGLLLDSQLDLGGYVACAGRTLPEFADNDRKLDAKRLSHRKALVIHGVQDTKLPILHGRNTSEILAKAGPELTYKEFSSDHGISPEMVVSVKTWIESRSS